LAALQNVTRTVPIVFVSVSDPVGAGYVASLARPGANTTGFTLFEYGTSGKWLELLKQIVPAMTRAAVIRDPSITFGTAQFAAIQAVAPSLGVELTPIDARDDGGIEQTIAGFTRESSCGLIVTASPSALSWRTAA
jgi:putative tryptophan/tyrosine transport system substrate-binding protein